MLRLQGLIPGTGFETIQVLKVFPREVIHCLCLYKWSGHLVLPLSLFLLWRLYFFFRYCYRSFFQRGPAIEFVIQFLSFCRFSL
jgi:hypothetical protein